MSGAAATPSPSARRGDASLALASLVACALSVGLIASGGWVHSAPAGRLALVGIGILAVALGVGSSRLVAVATLVTLGAALFGVASTPETPWVHAILVGCLLFITAELAWESIERRRPVRRSVSLDVRRAHEVATVVVLAVAAGLAAWAAATLGPSRGFIVRAGTAAALLAALALVIARVQRTAPDD